MWRVSLLFLLSFSFAFLSEAKERSADMYVFGAFNSKKESQVLKEPLSQFLEKSVDFVYLENSAPTLNQSIFYQGLSPRNLKIKYNGFDLTDSSSSEGVFDLRGISQFKGFTLQKEKTAVLSLHSRLQEGGEISLSTGSLSESRISTTYGHCGERACYKYDAHVSYLGGVSQLEGGGEDDFSKSFGVSLSRVQKGRVRIATHLLFNFNQADEDDLFSALDDPNATSRYATIFLGQEFRRGDSGVRLSFLSSDREQENKIDGLNLNTYKFNQLGQQFSLEFFKKGFEFKLKQDEFEFTNLKENDLAFEVAYQKTDEEEKNFLNTALLGYSKNKEVYGDVEFSFKDFNLIFRSIAPSLYQLFDENVGNKSLNAENLIGLSYNKNFPYLKKQSFKVGLGYYRLWDLIEFFDSDGVGTGDLGSYQNREEGGNLFASLENEVNIGSYSFKAYVRYLRAKDITSKADLLRRPRWTVGTHLKVKLIKAMQAQLRFKYIGKRFDFGGEELKPTLFTEVVGSKLYGWGRVYASAANVFNEQTPVFAGIQRKSFELKLGVDLNF